MQIFCQSAYCVPDVAPGNWIHVKMPALIQLTF